MNSNRESLHVKLFDRTSVGFNLHVSGFSWGMKWQKLLYKLLELWQDSVLSIPAAPPDVRRGFASPSLPISFFQLCACFAFHRSLQFGLALVIHLLPTRDSDFDFDAAVLEVKLCRDESHALLCRRFVQLRYLTLVQQQLAGSQRIVVLTIAMRIRR